MHQAKVSHPLPRLLLVACLPLSATAASEAPEALDQGAAYPESRIFETEGGNTVSVEREILQGEHGGSAVRRDVTVTDADGAILGEGRNVRYETAEGERGRVNTRTRTDAEGNSTRTTRSARQDAEGNVTARRAQTERNAEGDVTRRRVDRARRDADGGGARASRGVQRGENGTAANRRVVRSDGQGQRSVRTQRARRPKG